MQNDGFKNCYSREVFNGSGNETTRCFFKKSIFWFVFFSKWLATLVRVLDSWTFLCWVIPSCSNLSSKSSLNCTLMPLCQRCLVVNEGKLSLSDENFLVKTLIAWPIVLQFKCWRKQGGLNLKSWRKQCGVSCGERFEGPSNEAEGRSCEAPRRGGPSNEGRRPLLRGQTNYVYTLKLLIFVFSFSSSDPLAFQRGRSPLVEAEGREVAKVGTPVGCEQHPRFPACSIINEGIDKMIKFKRAE